MRVCDAKTVMGYYGGIPGMRAILHRELAELEGLHAVAADGLPRNAAPGDPTARAAERMAELHVRLEVLSADEAAVRACLDGLCGRYKRLLLLRHQSGYSWARIAAELHAPDSTVRAWYDRAIQRLAQGLEDVPMVGELVRRAACARI